MEQQRTNSPRSKHFLGKPTVPEFPIRATKLATELNVPVKIISGFFGNVGIKISGNSLITLNQYAEIAKNVSRYKLLDKKSNGKNTSPEKTTSKKSKKSCSKRKPRNKSKNPFSRFNNEMDKLITSFRGKNSKSKAMISGLTKPKTRILYTPM